MLEKSGPLASLLSASTTTVAPLPLSQMAATFDRVVTVPSAGMGRWRRMACSPWRSFERSDSTTLATPRTALRPGTTAKVGRTFWPFS